MNRYRSFAVATVLLAFVLGGCASLTTQPEAAKLVVQYATLKYVGDSPERAGRVISVVTAADAVAAQGAGTLDAFEAVIPWDALEPADRLLARNLVAILRAEIEERLDLGGTAPLAEHVSVVLGWVREAAEIAG